MVDNFPKMVGSFFEKTTFVDDAFTRILVIGQV